MSPSPSAGPSGPIAGSVLPLRRAEELIATLPGVLSVRIVPGETGAVEEIHVLTTAEVVPKHMVRNIESALMAQLGLRVNHRKVSIAQSLDPARAADVPAEAPVPSVHAHPAAIPGVASAAYVPGRPVAAEPAPAPGTAPTPVAQPLASDARMLLYEDIEVRRSRTRGVVCRVTLSCDGAEFTGEAEGQESERARMEVAARATVAAVMQAMHATAGVSRTVALEGAKRIDAFDRDFVFVAVLGRAGREHAVLTGSSEVRESAETSAVLAVLDATNRWMSLDG